MGRQKLESRTSAETGNDSPYLEDIIHEIKYILKLEAEKSFCKVGGNNKMDWDQYQLPNKKGVKLIRPIQLDSIYFIFLFFL